MNRWRVGDDRGSKEKDRCPLTGEERNILHEVRRSLRDGVQEEAVAKAAREL
jgi:hypothetical protein